MAPMGIIWSVRLDLSVIRRTVITGMRPDKSILRTLAARLRAVRAGRGEAVRQRVGSSAPNPFVHRRAGSGDGVFAFVSFCRAGPQ